ncbi:hypothetical protein NRH13_001168 [Proteus mirabilis]|nr:MULTISPECIES: hypothetical protein [Proteus]EKT8250738.1 hypothetical protein [Proteus mirabilis]EKU6772117.1 hypothetical protein [Proteus mirabilis]EKV7960555.1 hypothetical protein [Proteus mirabilis]EKY0303477.1 hypothetical protein [Proteus mirabilis]EKY1270102.1 hypothetical protein [Proteus mirabilis]
MYGLEIFPVEGGKPYRLTRDTQILCYLTSYQIGPEDWPHYRQPKKTRSKVIHEAMGYEAFAIPRVASVYMAVNDYAYFQGITHIRMEGPVLRYEYVYDNVQVQDPQMAKRANMVVDIYGIPLPDSTKPTYGVEWYGAFQGFRSAITRNTQMTYCVSRQKIHLEGGRYWSLPTTLPHLDKCVVFYHATNPQAEVSYLAHKKQLYSSAQTDIYVCVFVSGMVLTPKRRWGLSLYSEDGTLVFNTDYLPFTRGQSMALLLREGSVETPYSLPLVCATSQFVNASYQDDHIDWAKRNTGIRFRGKQIFVSERIRDAHRQHHVEQRIPFYVLNGSHYF